MSLSDVLRVGIRFVVCDLGAGTADFSQLQVTESGAVKETAAASGGPWGGRLVEKKMEYVLEQVFGIDEMNKFKKTFPVELL